MAGRSFFDFQAKHAKHREAQRKNARTRYARRVAESQGREVIDQRARTREALAQAIREAVERGWSGKIITKTNGGVFLVGGRDSKGTFHFGSSRNGWPAAFEDAERRDKEKGII
jgi:hypothetical protein